MTQGFQRVRKIYTLMGMYMKIGWKPLHVHSIFSISNNICSNNKNKHKKVCRLLDYRQREWNHILLSKCSDHQNYRYPLINQNLQRDFHLNLNQGAMVQEMGSYIEGSKNPITQTSTPKSMEEVVVEVMHIDKVVKLF